MKRPLLLLVLLTFFVVPLAVTACGGDDDSAEPAPAEPAPAEPAPAEEPAEEEAMEGDPGAGEVVFQEAGCGGCHTLAAAGSSGAVGPNLDDLMPSFETTVEQVTNGGGGMPAFGGDLTEQEINDVSQFVADAAGG